MFKFQICVFQFFLRLNFNVTKNKFLNMTLHAARWNSNFFNEIMSGSITFSTSDTSKYFTKSSFFDEMRLEIIRPHLKCVWKYFTAFEQKIEKKLNQANKNATKPPKNNVSNQNNRNKLLSKTILIHSFVKNVRDDFQRGDNVKSW